MMWNANKTQNMVEYANPSKPARPYTEYNFFFRLEREYILQVLLQVQPSVEADRIFDQSSRDYRGPPLPSRYNTLVLLDDWYIPGSKAQCRKHTKSHGKIGFNELSKKISQTWSNASQEVRLFCKQLHNIG